MTTTKSTYVRIPFMPKRNRLYQLLDVCARLPSGLDGDDPICPQCGKRLAAAIDIIQMGFFDDHYETWLVCLKCRVALKFVYTLSRIELNEEEKATT